MCHNFSWRVGASITLLEEIVFEQNLQMFHLSFFFSVSDWTHKPDRFIFRLPNIQRIILITVTTF